MIARVLQGGRSFKGSISYNETGKGGLQRKEDRVEWEWFRNLPTRNADVAACLMAATANAAVRGTAKPVYHFTVSLDPNDPLDPDTLRRIAERTLRDMDLEEHEVAVFFHKDRSHPHLHFVVNRVHPVRGTVWKPWRDFYRLERSMRAQERELGLRIVPGYLAPAFAPEHAIEGHEPERAPAPARLRPQPGPKRGDDAFLRDVIERATPVLERANSWAEFLSGLAEEGLSIRVRGGGFRLTDGRHDEKASKVGREFSRYHLEKRFGPYPDYRARMAVANAITPASRAVLRAPERRQAPPAEAIPSSTSEPPSSASESPATIPAATALPASSAEQGSVPEPQLEKPEIRFLREVRRRARPVFKHAQSWAELQHGLLDKGLILCVKGGGFVVTDGEQEVKASDIGRRFSRFYLEEAFGKYPGPSVPAEPKPGGSAAAPPADPVTADVPSAAPQLSTVATPPGQDETDDSSQFDVAPQLVSESPQLTLPLGSGTAPRSQPMEAVAGVVHLVTREELAAETPGERLATADPTRPAQPVSTGTHALGPAEQTTAASPAQLDVLVEVEASPARRDQTSSPELTSTERLLQADGLNQLDLPLVSGAPQLPLPARPTAVDLPRASAPVRGELTLETAPTASPSRSPRASQSAPVPRAQPPQPPGPAGPVRETPPAHSALPPRARAVQQKSAPAPAGSPGRPPTRRELYRDARRAFGRALAKVYVNPHAARREFAGDAYHRGVEEAVKRLQLEPHRFGRLRPGSRVEDAAAAARVGALYARYQIERVSAGLIHRLPEMQVAARAKAADQQIRRARTLAETVKQEHDRLRARVHDIAAADGLLLESARKIYRNPEQAISALKRHYEELVRVNAGKAVERMSTDIKAEPEQFGALRSNGDGFLARAREGVGFGNFSAARGQVPMLAKYFEHRAELGTLPSQARISAAAADAAAARDALESVEEIRRTISPQPVTSLVRSVAPDLRRVLRQVGRVELERKLSAMVPTDAFNLVTEVVSTVIELAEVPDREGKGRDF